MVQTNYAISFTTPPPSTGIVPATAMSPGPAVTLTESGAVFTASSVSISATDANADLTTTPATASTTNGVATFSSLPFNGATTGDTLTATLPLNPSAATPPSFSTDSTNFSVSTLTSTLSFSPSLNSQIYGTPIAAGSLDATASFNITPVAGTFTYTTVVNGIQTTLVAATTILPAGSYIIMATFTASLSNYGSTSTTAGYSVISGGVTLSFVPNPNSQTYGTPIAAGSLDATANSNNTPVPGTFMRTQGAGHSDYWTTDPCPK